MEESDLKPKLNFFGDVAYSSGEVAFDTSIGTFNHANLEGAILDPREPRETSWKAGPAIFQSGEALESGPLSDFTYSLANNHSMDFGALGLSSTLKRLGRSRTAGASLDPQDARKSILVDLEGNTLEIVSLADNFSTGVYGQFAGIATETPDDRWVEAKIRRSREKGRFPIISFHGGYEDYMAPSPVLVSKFRKWVDAGAELIVGHHSHLPAHFEVYKGKHIFYGLGNFLVEPEKWGRYHPYGLNSVMVSVEFEFQELRVRPSLLATSRLRSGGLCVVTENEEKSNRFFENNKRLGAILENSNDFEYVTSLIAQHFRQTFVNRQLLIAAFGRIPLFTADLLGRFGTRGDLPSKFLAPYLVDLFETEVTRDLIFRSESGPLGHRRQEFGLLKEITLD
jgi:hypothetical protein